MNNNNENKEWSLWSFLEEHKIEVPIIQRDYAQGRVGKEYLRKNFLSDIKHALDRDLPNGEKELKVDFVYGPVDNGVLQLLDGQQRLTTLWLLHWYIALRAGAESLEEACERLKNFSYATRATSRAFCEQLCRSKNFESFNGDKIVQFIKNSTWFYSAWEQDPTIQSMLRMLEGTKINNKKGSDITDGLEELFVGKERTYFEKYWGKLTKDAPIVFHHLTLEDFDLYDDLYVKMNQRGKKLTSFENFKADLIRYIRGQAAEEGSWTALSDIELSMDTTWTDIFWKNKSKDFRIDDIYFTFLNRFFMNYRIRDLSCGDKYYEYFEKDTAIEYSSLDNYKWKMGDGEDKEIEIGLFKDLSTILNNYYDFFHKQEEEEKLKSIFVCPWGIPFEFIPTYGGENNTIEPFGFIQRVVFYAVCKYFKEGRADEKSLKRWMRFVWNLVSVKEIIKPQDLKEKDYIRDVDKVKEAIETIDLIVDCHNVYEKIQNLKIEDEDIQTPLYKQLKEEREKVQYIMEKEEGREEREDLIKEAEAHSFFHGNIRFLYLNKAGDVDWNRDCFVQKLRNAKKYFPSNSAPTAEPLKILISWFPEDIASRNNEGITLRGGYSSYCGQPLFNDKESTWRFLLNNANIYEYVNNLLLGMGLRKFDINFEEEKESSNQYVLWMLSQTLLLDYLVKNKLDLHYRVSGGEKEKYSKGYEALFNSNSEIRILMSPADEKKRFEELLMDIKNEERNVEEDSQIIEIYQKYNPYKRGHFICQVDYNKGKKGWGDAFILVPEDEGNEIKSLKEYEKWCEEHDNDMIE